MSEWLDHPYTILLARLVLGVVFFRSGLGKAFDPKQTTQSVMAYEILPKSLAKVYGIALPWLELILVGLLLAGLWTDLAAIGLILLLISFGIAVTINLSLHKDMDCGCSGRAAREKLSWRTLVRIAFLLMLALAIQCWDTGYFSLNQLWLAENSSTTSFPPISDFLPLVLIVTLFVSFVKFLEATIDMFREHKKLRQELREQVARNLSENSF
ncbi:MAG: hypothetical protein Fur0022_28530 [Anaerolineales bacterium]